MNIGILKLKDGGYFGNLPTLNLQGVSFEAIEKKGNGPDFRVTVDGGELGAAWKKTSGKGNNYLSVQIDSPVFPAPINFAIFPKEGFAVAAWDRKEPSEQE